MQPQTRTSRYRCFGLDVISLKRRLFFRPLAVLLAILIAPAISWMEGGPSGSRPFQAKAQIQGCAATGNTIIQTYCANGTVYYTDLVQFESDAVSSYLALHNLPSTDAHLIYDNGREDLRNEIRGVMMDLLRAIIVKPASQRSTHEQTLYTWLQTLVQQNEIAEYTAALNNYASFESDPCHYTLDADLASQYKLAYDGTPWCFGGLQSSIFAPAIPSGDYFTAYGMKQSYEKSAGTYYYFSSVVAGTAIGEGETALVVQGAASTLASLTAGYAVFQGFLQQATLIAAEVINTVGSMTTAEEFASAVSSVIAPLLNVALFAGPVGILLDCIIAGVEAGLELYNNQQALATLNNINNSLQQAQSAPPDLTTFVNDSVGAQKLRMTLVSQTLPDVPSTSPLPAHGASDLNFSVSGGSVVTALSYQDWNQNIWTVETHGGWFVQTCVTGAKSSVPCPQTGNGISDSLNTSMQYVDWSGVDWIASRIGSTFVSVKANPSSTDVACPANAITGVSPGTNFSNCSSYASTSIPVTDSLGDHVSVAFSALAPPAFTSPTYFSFGPSIASLQTITVSGNPTPSVCVLNSNLTGDFTLNGGGCGNGRFQVAFNGDSNAPTHNYQLTLSASSSAGTVSQLFAIDVSPQLAIISPASMTVNAGQQTSFEVVATGVPAPKLSIDPLLDLGGLTFTDNGNGTGVIGGIRTQALTETCSHIVPPGPCGIIATSSQGTVEQQFTINVNPAPQPVIAGCTLSGFSTTCAGAFFTAGVPNKFLLTASGQTTALTWSLEQLTPTPPAWLTLTDNGDGTATLGGTPPAGTTGTFNAVIYPSAVGALDIGFDFPLTVVNTPVFSTPNVATFTAGTYGAFNVAATTGTIASSATLPQGLFFAPGNPAKISGVPVAGTGGQYTVPIVDTAGTGSTTQLLTLNVNEAAAITSPGLAVLFAGQPYALNVTTTGYPSVSTHAVKFGFLAHTPSDGMGFELGNVPATMQATNINSLGLATGTLALSGTPSTQDIGTRTLDISASNDVGMVATQGLTLEVFPYSGTTPVNLISSFVLSRDASHNLVATAVVANNGSGTAQNVAITSAKIGSATGAVSPNAVISVGPAQTGTFTIVFPAASVGGKGTAGVLSLSGAYTGGTFSSGGRIVLP